MCLSMMLFCWLLCVICDLFVNDVVLLVFVYDLFLNDVVLLAFVCDL